MTIRSLPPEALRKPSNPSAYGFRTTAELDPLDRLVGQDRPLEALEFGVSIEASAFNIFVVGEQGTGRRAAALAELRRRAAARPVPDEWCYVNNFDDPRHPRALRLPPGTARRLADDMERLAAQFAADLPRVFGGDEFRERRTAILRRLEEEQRALLGEAEAEAERRGLALVARPQAIVLLPKRDGRVLTEEEIAELSAEERTRIDEERKAMQTSLEQVLPRIADLTARAQKELQDLNRAGAETVAAHLLRALSARYRDVPPVLEFLGAVERDLLDMIGKLATLSQADPEIIARTIANEEFQRRYMVNVLVAGEGDGAPVIEEPNPTFANLLGRIEHRVLQGVLTTDFLMIRAGALLCANGGFLLVDAMEVLRRPLAWDALKRALRQCELRIEEPAAELGIISTVSLQPEPIPLDVKVVLVGPPLLYSLLSRLDPDFERIFKVKADFSPTIARTPESEHEYARLVATRCRIEGMPDFDAGAVAALVEYGARRAGDQERLTARLGEIADVAREAAFRARHRIERGETGAGELPKAADGGARSAGDPTGDTPDPGGGTPPGDGPARGPAERAADGALPDVATVTRMDVDAAIAARIRRVNRIEEEVLRLVEDGTLLVSTEGTAIGQVNGLSVLTPGDYAFAKPVRVSATVALGTRGVVDIERESTLGGPIHSKAVLILAGYLNHRYGGRRPLVLTASLGFEQVYEGVEGDSASLAELLALISAIARLPVRQDLAITGSVNQHGAAQPVGAVTEKVEGFFRACSVQGLTGSQGVLVPEANARHLMLDQELLDAVRERRFQVYAVSDVDDAIRLLFDRPPDEVHRAAESRLDAMVEEWRRLRAEPHWPLLDDPGRRE